MARIFAPVAEWFSPQPHYNHCVDNDLDWPGCRWYQKTLFNRWSDRIRIEIGDIVSESERENGECNGVKFAVDLHLWEHTGQFGSDYQDHSFYAILWRWGVYLAWRGRRVP